MSVLDIVVGAGLLASLVLGAWRGLAYEVMSLLNWLLAFVLAQWLGPMVGQHLPLSGSADGIRHVAGFVLVFLVSAFAGGLVAKGLSSLLEKVGLRPVDRVLGAVFGLLRGLLVVLVLAALGLMASMQRQAWWQESVAARSAQWTLQGLRPVLPQGLGRYLP